MRLGYLKDDRRVVDPKAGAKFGAAPIAAAADLTAHVVSVLDQGANDCVANALSQAIRMTWHAAGDASPPLPSRRLIYWAARSEHGAKAEDLGTYPRAAMNVTRRDGYTTEASCPYQPMLWADPPPPSAYRDSYDQCGSLAYYRCEDDPVLRRLDISTALSAGHPVILGVQVDEAFMRGPPGAFWRYAGPSIGGHMLCCVGFDQSGVRIVNSWGLRWGDAGFATIAWDTICDESVTSDPYAILTAREP